MKNIIKKVFNTLTGLTPTNVSLMGKLSNVYN